MLEVAVVVRRVEQLDRVDPVVVALGG